MTYVDGPSPGIYQITVKGHLDRHWSDWFDGLTVTPVASGETHLTGPVRDQAALHGLLTKLRDLGLPLIAVHRLEEPAAGEQHVRQGQADIRSQMHLERGATP
jgi:hypothetical protein